MLPLINGGKKIFENKEWFKLLEEKEPNVHYKLLNFRAKTKELREEISRLCIPASIPEIPEILKPILDIRKIIYSNCSPIYRILSCMGLDCTINLNNKEYSLISDIYGSI